MNFKAEAIVAAVDQDDYTYFSPITTVPCTDVLIMRDREEDFSMQKMYQTYLEPIYENLSTQHHLIIDSKRYAIQDIRPLPVTNTKAVEVRMVMYDPVGLSIGEETPL